MISQVKRYENLSAKLSLILICFIFITAFGCNSNDEVTVYPIKKEKTLKTGWLPLNRTVYKIDTSSQTVNSYMPNFGFPKHYKKCKCFNSQNWECKYKDGSGTFGMNDGEYFALPKWEGVQYVSWWIWWYHHLRN